MPNTHLPPEDEANSCAPASGRPRFESVAGSCTMVGWLARGVLAVALLVGGMAVGRPLGALLYRLMH